MNKKFLFGLILFILIFNVNARFYFQDNTLTHSIRLCDGNTCENLENGNISAGANFTNVYEIGGDRLQVNPLNFVKDNLFYIAGVIILLFILGFVAIKIFKRP